jgi:limonene-1,2-epoxide hydrolase
MANAVGDGASEGQVDQQGGATTPTIVVERFLELLRGADLDRAFLLLAPDVEYTNVSLPSVHGRERVRQLFRAGYERGGGFEVYMHTISAAGPSVLTERTDVLKLGRLRVQLWVCGRFDVRDGQIVLWRDYFDWLNATVAVLRGLLGVFFPPVRSKPPSVV